jgi:hypothetical protein
MFVLKERKSTHPWLNDTVRSLVAKKHEADGTADETKAREACSKGILDAYATFAGKTKEQLLQLRRASKGWWTKTRHLLQQRATNSSIPALKDPTGCWVLKAEGKATLFATTFVNKYHLAAERKNRYTRIEPHPFNEQKPLRPITDEAACKTLGNLDVDSATGPDQLPSRILKTCAKALAEPVRRLTCRILEAGIWPEAWLIHWIVPLHKKKSVCMSRGITEVSI